MPPSFSNTTSLAFDRGTDPILNLFSPDQVQQLVNYRGDESLQIRIEELARKNTEDKLSEEELAEYEGYVRANNFIAILQAKARKLLNSHKQ